jgi:uncharacterized membrane protein YgcG
MPDLNPGDRIRISPDHRGHLAINRGMNDLGEVRVTKRGGPRLTLGDRRLRVHAFVRTWRVDDEDTGETIATLTKRSLHFAGATFTLRRRPFERRARLVDAEGRTLLRFERAREYRRRSLIAIAVEPPPPEVDGELLAVVAAALVVLRGTYRPPKQRNPEGERVGAWARGGQWGRDIAIIGGFAGIGDLTAQGSGLFGGDSGGGGGLGELGGGGDFGGGGDGGGGGGP